jgi:hypothetical protein
VIRPLPPHTLQGAGYTLLPGFAGCLTAGKPVPSQAGYFFSIVFFICRPNSSLILLPVPGPAQCRGPVRGSEFVSRYHPETEVRRQRFKQELQEFSQY